MLTDQQHAEVKRLLKRAIDGTDWNEKHHALEDACKIVGVISDRKKYICPEFMKAGTKPRRSDEELKQVVADAADRSDPALYRRKGVCASDAPY